MRIKLGFIAICAAGLATLLPAHAANIATGRYTLIAQNSNRCVQAPNGSTGIGIQLQQSTCNNSVVQQYDISPTDSGYYKTDDPIELVLKSGGCLSGSAHT